MKNNQIQQEQVEEEHRGVIGGVQSSLQQLFDMAKFLLVIFMPDPNMFGILILASFAFVSLGAVSMTTYAVLRGKFKCIATSLFLIRSRCYRLKSNDTDRPQMAF